MRVKERSYAENVKKNQSTAIGGIEKTHVLGRQWNRVGVSGIARRGKKSTMFQGGKKRFTERTDNIRGRGWGNRDQGQ